MTMTATSAAGARTRSASLGVWALRIVVGAAFLLAALMKLGGRPAMVVEFDAVGLGQWFRYFTAILELTGGIALLVPAVSVFGAMLLLVVDLGALVAQVTVLHVDWIHTVVIALLLLVLVYIQRAALLPTRR